MLTDEELVKYSKLIDAYIKPNLFACCSPASGILKYPYVNPSAQYLGMLWDWDSFWVTKTMIMALERYKKDPDFDYENKKKKTWEHAIGTIKNFFDYQEDDGFTPMMIVSSGPFMNFYNDEHKKGNRHNTIKPFLLQQILMISEYWDNYSWFDLEKALKYIEYYENAQRDKATGLFYWVDDVMIGIDNNPTVFFRPNNSSADIFLNGFMALEYDSLVKLLQRLGDSRFAEYKKKAENFKATVNGIMYDKKDKIYYSHDLSIYTPDERLVANGFLLHENMIPSWHSLPLKIRFWGCFVPIYAGICSESVARNIDLAHFHDCAIMANYGIRTAASDEFCYNLEKTSNPSNWLGAIWFVANYCIYKGLKNYNIDTYKVLAEKSIRLLGENLEKTGEMYESYLPDTGEPCLYPHFFNWNLLVMEMLEDFGY